MESGASLVFGKVFFRRALRFIMVLMVPDLFRSGPIIALHQLPLRGVALVLDEERTSAAAAQSTR